MDLNKSYDSININMKLNNSNGKNERFNILEDVLDPF